MKAVLLNGYLLETVNWQTIRHWLYQRCLRIKEKSFQYFNTAFKLKMSLKYLNSMALSKGLFYFFLMCTYHRLQSLTHYLLGTKGTVTYSEGQACIQREISKQLACFTTLRLSPLGPAHCSSWNFSQIKSIYVTFAFKAGHKGYIYVPSM